jgi:2,3-bisphosphoglycerate-independent phosphoglycerate mutase
MNKKFIALCVLDGWGLAPKGKYNAITNANPKFFNYLLNNFPTSKLHTSGKHIGLPEGQMGNSEVGHMTLGSGRVIKQDLPRINDAIQSGEIFQNTHLWALINKIDKTTNSCHLVGLASDGAVHSHMDHMLAISKFLAEHGIKVNLHWITDGRDTSPNSAAQYLKKIEDQIQSIPNISTATIGGRFYAMDRDKRYDRTSIAYNVITHGINKKFTTASNAALESYVNKITDEFIEPQSAINYSGTKNGDALIFVNFRADRMRQLCSSMIVPEFNHFQTTKKDYAVVITMAPYSEKISRYASSLFKPLTIKNNFPEILSQNNIAQLRATETEKYAHVSFFFNSGKEQPYPLEKRILINSPKIRSYDLKPEMSAYELTDQVVREIMTNQYQFLLINYANTDMVGHTGNYAATLQAVKAVDNCLQKLSNAIYEINGTLLVTADHGNAEDMFNNEISSINTAHTTNPVPFIVTGREYMKNNIKLKDGTLADIAPTILNLYGIETPKEMTGQSLMAKIKELA